MKLAILLSHYYDICNPVWIFYLTYELDINEFFHLFFNLQYQLGTKTLLRLLFRQKALPGGQITNSNFMIQTRYFVMTPCKYIPTLGE